MGLGPVAPDVLQWAESLSTRLDRLLSAVYRGGLRPLHTFDAHIRRRVGVIIIRQKKRGTFSATSSREAFLGSRRPRPPSPADSSGVGLPHAGKGLFQGGIAGGWSGSSTSPLINSNPLATMGESSRIENDSQLQRPRETFERSRGPLHLNQRQLLSNDWGPPDRCRSPHHLYRGRKIKNNRHSGSQVRHPNATLRVRPNQPGQQHQPSQQLARSATDVFEARRGRQGEGSLVYS